eukprot:4526584-Amphidinium_carterae.1
MFVWVSLLTMQSCLFSASINSASQSALGLRTSVAQSRTALSIAAHDDEGHQLCRGRCLCRGSQPPVNNTHQ